MKISSNPWREPPRSFPLSRASVGFVVEWAVRGCRLGLLLLLMAQSAATQEPRDEEGTILIDVRVNHGVAYRAEYWTPVDVLVNNTERDVEGSVEIRLYDFSGNLMSPIHRLPANSPQNSKKLFRLYCRLDGASRLEAHLYAGSRPAVPLPTRLDLGPIGTEDYLGLVLDENYHDYGFLSGELVIGQPGRRFHREGLHAEQVDQLSDFIQCYQAFDIIILGDIEPDRIAPLHRDLLVQYVESGGTLVVSLGKNAARYKGTWVEPLLGVTIGENSETTDGALCERAFGTAILTENAGVYTAIQPATEGVVSIGSNFLAGAWRPHGAGTIAAVTVDAHGQLLSAHPEFHRAWNDLLRRGGSARPLNLGELTRLASAEMPRIAGVRLFPVSSILLYLFLYFSLGIVGNWIFWNRRKRREMAWVCLVFISFAFTAYAMIFGTQGRARSTELEQLEVLEISANSPRAMLHGLTGLLAKGSGRFDASFTNPSTLASDVSQHWRLGTNNPGGFGMTGTTPFQFIQGEPGGIANLTVGASEMRFVQTEAPLYLEGALETDLYLESGRIRGTISNKTALELENPRLIYRGRAHLLDPAQLKGEIDLDTSRGMSVNNSFAQIAPNMITGVPENSDMETRSSFRNFLGMMAQGLVAGQGARHAPCIVGWATGPQRGSLDMGAYASPHFGATLVLAWIELPDRTARGDRIELQVSIWDSDSYAPYYPGGPGFGNSPYPMPMEEAASAHIFQLNAPEGESEWYQSSVPFALGQPLELQISLPQGAPADDDFTLEVEVIASPELGAPSRSFRRYRGSVDPANVLSSNTDGIPPLRTLLVDPATSQQLGITPKFGMVSSDSGVARQRETFRIDDWERYVARRESFLRLRLNAIETDAIPNHRVHIGAQLIKKTDTTTGD